MTQEERKDDGGQWIGIPSIPAQRVGQGLLAFILAIAIVTTVDVLLIMHNQRPATWQLTAELVFDDGSSIVAWSLPLTWPIMEVIRMVLAGIWENRNRRRHIAQGREEGLEEGREEGLEQGLEQGLAQGREQGKTIGFEAANNAWRDWLRRKEDAEVNGVPFNEPTPGDNGDRNAPPSFQA